MPSLEASFTALADRELAADSLAGILLRVEDASGLRFEAARGSSLRTATQTRSLATDDVFDLASISKIFTTTAVLRLATLGRLDLGAPVCEVLGWTSRDLAGPLDRITCRSLLAHSSGIHYWYPFYTRRGEAFEAILESVLAEHPPTGEVVYSDLNFMILGKVVEAATGLSLPAAMASLVLEPLGLDSTSYAPRSGPEVVATEFGNSIEEGMVAGLGLAFSGWRPHDKPIRCEADDGNCHYYFGGAAGHAGIFSRARDLAALGRLYLGGGRAKVGGRELPFLDPGLVQEASRDHGGGRGLGFQLGANYPGGGYGHTGFTGTYLHINPASGLVIVLLTNRLHVASPHPILEVYREAAQLGLGLAPGPAPKTL